MSIENFKESIKGAEITDEAKRKIEEIINDEGGAEISEGSRDKIIKILDLEEKRETLEANALDNSADALSDFADNLDELLIEGEKMTRDQISELESNLSAIEEELKE